MAVNFEDTVFGFDLNYLHQTTDYNLLQSRIEKQRMAILKAKKKTVCTDSLIRKYHEKQQLLEEIEKDFLASKEECKQICIEYKSSLEKCSKLEAETKNLQTINHELENDLRTAKNQQEAILSHSNQLQILIKDYETRLEALKIENQLEKIKPKNNEKKVGCVAKDNSELMKHIQIILDLAVKNNNLNGKDKRLLKKYKKLYKLGESSQDAEDSEDETETYECNEDTEFIIDANKNIQTGKPERNLVEIDRDSNASNEIVSIDTGRGSSLAFSDSDKCFQSPEYFSDDSPPSVDSLSNNKKSYANKSTSPISVRTNNAASSPVKELQILHGFEKQITDVKRNEIATSPVQFNDTDVSCEENTEDYVDTNNPLDDDNSNDCEIETILSSMRLNHNLITPIPSTPSKSRTRTISERSEHVCLEAAKVREENKTLQVSLTNLTKEVMNIKSMLKLHFMSNDHDTGHNNYLRAPDGYTPNIHENKAAEIFIANEEAIFDPHSDNESQCSIASLDTVVNELPTTEDDTVLLESSEIVHESSEIVHESSEIVHESSEIDHESSSLMVINDSVPINASRNLSFEEDPEANEVLDSLNNSNNLNISIHERCDALPQIGKKNMRKLTKLQRLRINMLPKGKIPNARSMPQRKLRMKPKQLKMRKKKKPNKNDSSATLNDKDVYEKAVKVMAELKSKKLLQKGKQLALKQANKNNSCDIDVNCNENLISKSKENIVEIDSQKDKSSVQSSENNTTSIQCTDTVILTPKSPINTQSQSKQVVNEAEVSVKQIQRENLQDENNVGSINEGDNKLTTNHCITQETREKKKSLKRPSLDTPEIENKRVLRSSSAHLTVSYSSQRVGNDAKPCDKSECKERQTNNSHRLDVSAITNYSDLDIFTEEPTVKTAYKTRDAKENVQDGKSRNPQESILCEMLQKYGATKANKNRHKKISESVINSMCKNIQDGIGEIIALPPNETKSAMNALVERLGKCQLKPLLMGLMNYLKDPARKAELFNKVHTSSAPPMTKSEQVLLYILTNLRGNWPGIDFIGCVLDNMEYTLFKLNCTPEFETIESMSHFYAVLCRYMKDKSRLRLFILDAMYCIQFKAVPLIKQCMEVWMHILPLAHLGLAKSPLVMCVVYLLHFFKCEDRFNRVTEIRNILNRKYFYKFSDWSETKILEMFRSSIRELKDDKIETKMLRLALIVLAKRQGPQWCQNNIIKNLLQPMIEDETAPEKVKVFSLSMIGPLLKPYPAEMKVHCEVVMNQLIDSINSTSSVRLQEAIFTSLIYMNKHNPNRVVRALLSWSPKHVTPEMESIFKEFVRGKPLKIWKQQLSRLN